MHLIEVDIQIVTTYDKVITILMHFWDEQLEKVSFLYFKL